MYCTNPAWDSAAYLHTKIREEPAHRRLFLFLLHAKRPMPEMLERKEYDILVKNDFD